MHHLELSTPKMKAWVADGVGWLMYNQPEKHNAMSYAMQQAAAEALELFADDPEVRAVAVRGAGEQAFISGADISEFGERRTSPRARREYDTAVAAVSRAFARLEKPVIAMIHGYCIGGGLATALQADIRLAADDATFGIPAARLGVGYGFTGVQRLVDIAGPAAANEILITARRFDAKQALRWGLLNRIVPKARLEAETAEMMTQIAGNAPLTVRASKVAVRHACRDAERRDIAYCDELVEQCFDSQDYREGQTAFAEKRTPRFEGR